MNWPLPSRHPHARPRGFTLVELLSATAVTMVVLTVLLASSRQSSRGFGDTRRRVEIQSEARAALDFIHREVATRVPGTRWFATPGDDPGARTSDRIGFFRVLGPGETAPGQADIAAVGYYVAFTEHVPGRVSPKLFRQQLPAEESFELMKLGDAAVWPEPDPALDEPLAANVVGFRARLLERTEAGGSLVPWRAEPDGATPEWLELALDLADHATAGRLRREADWRGESAVGAQAVGTAAAPESGAAVRRHSVRRSIRTWDE